MKSCSGLSCFTTYEYPVVDGCGCILRRDLRYQLKIKKNWFIKMFCSRSKEMLPKLFILFDFLKYLCKSKTAYKCHNEQFNCVDDSE